MLIDAQTRRRLGVEVDDPFTFAFGDEDVGNNVLGGVLGVALSLAVQNVVAYIESVFNIHFLKSDVYPISFLPAEILWRDVFWVLAISILMSLLATVYPSLKASRIKPAEALRYE